MRRQLGLVAHPLPHLLQPLPAALEIRPQPALLLDRLVHLPARRDGVRLFACRDLLGIRAPLDRGRGMAHLHGPLHLYALAGVATMIDPPRHLRQFHPRRALFGPPPPAPPPGRARDTPPPRASPRSPRSSARAA